jgi:3-deoxy-D-manno-octulosonic-acid transferase
LYPAIARLISGKNPKARLWLQGRKNLLPRLQQAFAGNTSPVIWMHCSSLGEFEQGRPVLEAIRQQFPQYKWLVTFFSPSGYEVRKNYEHAHWVFYLPMDSHRNASQFLHMVQPKLIIFIKYEFWYHYLHQAHQRNIPLLLVSGIFRQQQVFFTWYGGFYRQMLGCFTHLFVQNQSSLQLLQGIGITQASVCGDTRFDRVLSIAAQTTTFSAVEAFINNCPVIVAGSTWTADDEELYHFANTNPHIRFIVAPHHIDDERLNECLHLYRNSILYCQWLASGMADAGKNVLIIDNIGMLSSLYRYATIAYVGGGFGADGVHNTLEAAVFAKPIVFGPEYAKYQEAKDLVATAAAFSVTNALELENTLQQLLQNNTLYTQSCTQAGNYVQQQAGATQKVINYCISHSLLQA